MNSYLLKIKVNNVKECKEIQEILFDLGCVWNSGDSRVLYCDNSKGNYIDKTITEIKVFYEIASNTFRLVRNTDRNGEGISLKTLRGINFRKKIKKKMVLEVLEER